MPQLHLITDPREFLERAGDLLASRPVVSTVLSTTVRRKIRNAERGVEPDERDWWLVVTDDDASPIGVGMGQPPDAMRRIFLLDLPAEVIDPLADLLLQRGSGVDWVNGARPTVDRFAAAWAQRTHSRTEIDTHTRLFELGTLTPGPPSPGGLREPRPEEYELVAAWLSRFQTEAAVQGGREPDAGAAAVVPVEEVADRVDDHRLWVWADQDQPVHLTGFQPPSFGVARIGPVYTPPQFRGHGYAASAVAQVSQRLQGEARVCLFTDQANPVSNALYERLGYRAVVDMANHRVIPQ